MAHVVSRGFPAYIFCRGDFARFRRLLRQHCCQYDKQHTKHMTKMLSYESYVKNIKCHTVVWEIQVKNVAKSAHFVWWIRPIWKNNFNERGDGGHSWNTAKVAQAANQTCLSGFIAFHRFAYSTMWQLHITTCFSAQALLGAFELLHRLGPKLSWRAVLMDESMRNVFGEHMSIVHINPTFGMCSNNWPKIELIPT